MKLRNTLRLLGASTIAFLAACSDDQKAISAPDIAPPRTSDISGAALGNFVWYDKNANGVQDPGEPGIPNATVVMIDPGNFQTVQQTTTSNDRVEGNYVFGGLFTPAMYKICVATPAGFDGISPAGLGGNPAFDSDGAGAQNCFSYNLVPDEQNFNIDFGFYKLASLGDFVWYDKNGNGKQDDVSEEPGIPNALVTIKGKSNSYTSSMNTGSLGEYRFDNLIPGTYEVCVGTPNGYSGRTLIEVPNDTTIDSNGEGVNNCSDVTIVSEQHDPTVDFGFVKSKASLGDRVWHDRNADGVQDDQIEEPGIVGATVQLLVANQVVASTVTIANGFYNFLNLEPGTYTVCVATPATFVRISPADAAPGNDDTIDSDGKPTTTGNCHTVTLALGEYNPTIDFGFYKLGTIGDFVWSDLNSDGIQNDGQNSGIAGVTVTLTKPDGSTVNQQTTASGGYLFTDLVPGNYKVCINTLPAGFSAPTDDKAQNGAFPLTDSNGSGTPNCDTKTLKSEEIDLTIDFGFIIIRGSLGDYVWHDANANGIQDATEKGIEGATVTITGPNGFSDSHLTNQDGGYAFTDLLPGSYTVCVATPTGYNAVSPADATADDKDSDATGSGNCTTTVLGLGQHNPTLDFGFYTLVSIGNYVWHDKNANGKQDPDETGIQGATVTMTGPTQLPNATTNASGGYLFDNLKPGTYTVCVALPGGYTNYSPLNGATSDMDSNGPGISNNCTSTTVLSGQQDMTLDFGFFKLASLGDFVWADVNANGVQNGGSEVGIANVNLRLTGPSGVLTTVTNAQGGYSFTGLIPGSYQVCVMTMPVGYTGFSPMGAGGDPTQDSNGAGGAHPNCAANVTLTSGQHDPTIDFGYTKAAVVLGSLGDFVWHDKNGNGIQDANEPGIAGAKVTMTMQGNATVNTATTDANGMYSFTGLAAGTYTVCAVRPTGYTGTTGTGLGGDTSKDSNGDGTATNCSAPVVLAAGATNLTIDFGFYYLGSIGDYTWYDKDDDGIQDAGEAAFNGVKITMTGTASATATTANGGKYLFSNLKPGTYKVCAAVPSGYHSSTPLQGPDRAKDSNGEEAGNCSTVILASGENNLTIDFGFDCGKTSPTLASVGDFVWNDENANGVQDSGEDGIKNATVKITGANGFSKTTTTNSYGKYLFSDLNPGTYTICVASVSGGYSPTGADKGGNDAKDSDGTGAGNCASVTLSAGEQDLTIDFGFTCKPVNTASLQGYVWYDNDNNGQQGGNEAAINGKTVNLYNSSNTLLKTTSTNSSGKYYFTGLAAGTYKVCVAVSSGYAASPANIGNDATDSDGTGTDNCATVTLAAGENKIDPDFGMYCKPVSGAIGSYVWNDADKDGIQDNGESGISGRTVYLTGAATKQTTTDGNGKYSFTGLAAGQYTVCVAAPSGYTPTTADASNDDVDSDGKGTNNCATLTLASGQTNNSIDFGFFCANGVVAGTVWYDKNWNGLQDGGYEVGMKSKTVTLKIGSTTKTATTDADGNYRFTGLAAGTYTVCGTVPSGYKASPAKVGSNTAKDSDGAGSSNCATVVLAAGGQNLTTDFGYDYK